jgi:Lipid A 3-O-deacylase (PagL)
MEKQGTGITGTLGRTILWAALLAVPAILPSYLHAQDGSHMLAISEVSSEASVGSDSPDVDSGIQRIPTANHSRHPDFNDAIYFRNKLEFSLDAGWLPINVPFPFDVFEGDPYDLYPLRYTLVPIVASVRWHLGNAWGWPVIRGNWDLTAGTSFTAIPRGAETRYFAYDMGLRRNFIPRNWRVTPYWDVRAGVGLINAKGPLGVYYAQGQNFTFNINMGAGVRYNLSPRYALSAGLNWMHISNANLSAPAYSNYGINVYGPMVGLDVLLRGHPGGSE